MSRFTKFLSLSIVLLFILACTTVTQPISDVQNLAGTAQAFATTMPIETLKAVASEMPIETLQALPSAVPTLEALASAMPDFSNMFNPQGEPLKEWNGIPVMDSATAGQEFDSTNYSFKFTGTVKEAEDFYNGELVKLGWSSAFSMPSNENGSVLAFQKDSNFLTITIISTDGSTVVLFTLA